MKTINNQFTTDELQKNEADNLKTSIRSYHCGRHDDRSKF